MRKRNTRDGSTTRWISCPLARYCQIAHAIMMTMAPSKPPNRGDPPSAITTAAVPIPAMTINTRLNAFFIANLRRQRRSPGQSPTCSTPLILDDNRIGHQLEELLESCEHSENFSLVVPGGIAANTERQADHMTGTDY